MATCSGQAPNHWLSFAVLWGHLVFPGCELLLVPYHMLGSRAEMISSVVQEPKMLEELTGLAAMHAAAEMADLDFEDSDDEDAAADEQWTSI